MNEAAFLSVIRGDDRRPAAHLARFGLHALSWGYGFGVRMRNAAFEAGLKSATTLPVPVISVGNITAGGTGKTPFVACLAGKIAAAGVRPAIVSRGYGALAEGHNDEFRVLARLCPNVPHVQNPDRIAAGETALREHSAQALILDDGFQHRRLARDLDIVLIDALNPWGHGHLLPRGLLREPPVALRRAGLVAITRADQSPPHRLRELRDQVAAASGIPPEEILEVAYPPHRLIDVSGDTRPLNDVAGKRVLAFCGIGNPAGFHATLDRAGILVPAKLRHVFGDHHHYSADDLTMLAEEARRIEAAGIVTTLKDLVKLPATGIDGIPVHAIDIRADFLTGEEILNARLSELLTRSANRRAA